MVLIERTADQDDGGAFLSRFLIVQVHLQCQPPTCRVPGGFSSSSSHPYYAVKGNTEDSDEEEG